MKKTYEFIESTAEKLSTDLYSSIGSLPSREKVLYTLSVIRRVLFPGFFDEDPSSTTDGKKLFTRYSTTSRRK